VSLGIQLSDALGAAHERGIVHRDFNPANVLLTEDARAKVTDFGLAKLERSGPRSKLTQMGTVMGTPDYMSPEQASGGQAEAPSDIYALGATLYEMLVRAPVFEGELQQVLLKHCTQPPLPPSQRGVTVSADLEALILQMLAKTPAERPSSMQEVTQRLNALASR
jgi:serine/threonine-protein kinase